METMRQYVVRRAAQEKNYKRTVQAIGLDEGAWEWLAKLAQDKIRNPGSERIEKLYHHYKLLEVKQRRKAA